MAFSSVASFPLPRPASPSAQFRVCRGYPTTAPTVSFVPCAAFASSFPSSSTSTSTFVRQPSLCSHFCTSTFPTPVPMTAPSPTPSHPNNTTAVSTSPSLAGPIEVERKFVLTDAVKEQLLRHKPSSASISSLSFRDDYYDTNLTLRDIWLRKRDDTWQVKLPVFASPASDEDSTTPTPSQSSGAAVYSEVSGTRAVKEALTSTLASTLSEENGNGPIATNTFDLNAVSCYASLCTLRTEFVVTWHGRCVNVTLDEVTAPEDADFTCSVGELELMVEREQDIDAAAKALKQLALHLNVDPVLETDGKLITFLRVYRPALFKQLMVRPAQT